MTLSKYYTYAVIYPAVFAFIISTLFSLIYGYGYDSEWLMAGDMVGTSIAASLIYSTLIGVLSLTIFLNKYEMVRANLIWNILAWFLLPGGFIAITLVQEVNYTITYESGFGSGIVFVLIQTIPFIAGLIYTFIRYRLSTIYAE
ncbi:MAG: hypothetical protein IPK76_16190 [Lewinellaceae bacterium]|jgi:hypothetical protein|nr:hypothetical protein [Lewinellaceae bacterium]